MQGDIIGADEEDDGGWAVQEQQGSDPAQRRWGNECEKQGGKWERVRGWGWAVQEQQGSHPAQWEGRGGEREERGRRWKIDSEKIMGLKLPQMKAWGAARVDLQGCTCIVQRCRIKFEDAGKQMV